LIGCEWFWPLIALTFKAPFITENQKLIWKYWLYQEVCLQKNTT
jgi:hypothetical protein